MFNLPFNLDNIIYGKTVEQNRIEYKRNITEATRASIGATICAFANDFFNQNGGWIIIGIDAPDGKPILPPVGVDDSDVEKIQQEIRVLGKKITPIYNPAIFVEKFIEKTIVVVYVPAGEERPYTAQDPRRPQYREYFIRHGAETVKANKRQTEQLIEISTKIPFDDRTNISADMNDIDTLLIRKFIESTNSRVKFNVNEPLETYKLMHIVGPFHDQFKPKNVSLLIFNSSPEKFFKSGYFEIVQFGDNVGGDIIEERKFTGPIDQQVFEVIRYLDNLTSRQYLKSPGKAAVEKVTAFPFGALEETIANAAYHRSYDSINEPSKIYLYPDRMEIISYPGPVPGLKLDDFKANAPVPPAPLRNRRLGEFFKEMRLAEMRSTGIPKIKKSMEDNGSPHPLFYFDEDSTFFKVTLPAHPKYVLIHTIRESSYLWSVGERAAVIQNLEKVFNDNKGSGVVASQLIEYYYNSSEDTKAEEIFMEFHKTPLKTEYEQPYLSYYRCLINNRKKSKAKSIINLINENYFFEQPIDIAVAFKRIEDYRKSHIILSRVYKDNEENFVFLRNYAEVKISLSNEIWHSKSGGQTTVRRLQREALELLNKAIPLASDKISKGWCCFNLARVKRRLRYPVVQIEDAFEQAIKLLPDEKVFKEIYDRWRQDLSDRRSR
ncbi:MAG: hypothetical protein GY839_21290 [candidate division Zixibacteria bacterium]|nr:hypothetical protein [candidate division Zixibacteria bacterium]